MEKMLLAVAGGSSASGKAKGLLQCCVPLAATPKARGVIDTIGIDMVWNWLDANAAEGVINAPRAGGLWVLEFADIEDDEDAIEGFKPVSCIWRTPSSEELGLVLEGQLAQSPRPGLVDLR